MVERTRTEDEEDVTAARWMNQVTVGLERLSNRIESVEKADDRLTAEIRAANETSKTAAEALVRIAKSEEERNRIALEDRKLTMEDRKNRSKWLERIWSSQPMQLLLLLTIAALFNVMGFAYLVDQYVTPPVLARPTSTEEEEYGK